MLSHDTLFGALRRLQESLCDALDLTSRNIFKHPEPGVLRVEMYYLCV